MNHTLSKGFSWVVALLTPLFLIGLALRLMLAPWFLQLEYRMPYFPADEFGFSTQDRLHWAPYALNFLTNHADVSYLADLRFDDGKPLFNERELSHMLDVQHVVDWGLRLWLIDVSILVILAIWAWRSGWMADYLRGLRRGGWLMLGIATLLAMFAIIDFWGFFSWFHSLFFKGDTWLFEYSDTLIRLFPLQFWQDVFIWVAVIVVGCATGLALGIKDSRLSRLEADFRTRNQDAPGRVL